jgi:DNA-binding LacI/PurR family transcriptional regulator
MRALSARQVRIPDDVSVIVAGSAAWYDVWPSGGLTSITLPMAELADTASELALRDATQQASPGHVRSMRAASRGVYERNEVAYARSVTGCGGVV